MSARSFLVRQRSEGSAARRASTRGACHSGGVAVECVGPAAQSNATPGAQVGFASDARADLGVRSHLAQDKGLAPRLQRRIQRRHDDRAGLAALRRSDPQPRPGGPMSGRGDSYKPKAKSRGLSRDRPGSQQNRARVRPRPGDLAAAHGPSAGSYVGPGRQPRGRSRSTLASVSVPIGPVLGARLRDAARRRRRTGPWPSDLVSPRLLRRPPRTYEVDDFLQRKLLALLLDDEAHPLERRARPHGDHAAR